MAGRYEFHGAGYVGKPVNSDRPPNVVSDLVLKRPLVSLMNRTLNGRPFGYAKHNIPIIPLNPHSKEPLSRHSFREALEAEVARPRPVPVEVNVDFDSTVAPRECL